MRIVIVSSVIFILVILSYFSFKEPTKLSSLPKSQNQDELSTAAPNKKQINTDSRASFAIFTNNTFRVFTQSMYHNLSDDVYIESKNPNIVYIKKEGVTWDYFFKTLPFKLTEECLTAGTGESFCTNTKASLKFYLNGKLEQAVLHKIISQGDKLLISYGNESDSDISKQLSKIPNP